MSDVTAPGRARIARRLSVAVAGVLITASCAAGQHAQTADIRPAIDGTDGTVGTMELNGVAIHAPGSASSYASGSNADLAVTLINNGHSTDSLVSVTGAKFTGWGIVDNADAVATGTPAAAATGLTIDAGTAQRLSLADLGASATASPKTLVLTSLKGALYPGSAIDITFRFAKAGTTTLHVPVRVTSAPVGPTLPALTGSSEG